MKKEYDFSKAERGKFYTSDLTLNLPVYLDKENKKFFEKVAKENKSDLSTVVNKILKENIKLAQVLK
jgi:hypothetical protein